MISSIPSQYYNQGGYISYNQSQVPNQSIVSYVSRTRRTRASDFFRDYEQYKEKGEISENELKMEKKLEDVKKMNIELERKIKDLKESINYSRRRSRSRSRERYSRRYSRDRSRSRSRERYSQRHYRRRSRSRSRERYSREHVYKHHNTLNENYKVTPCKHGISCKYRNDFIYKNGKDCSYFHFGDTPKHYTLREVAIKSHKYILNK